MKYYAELLAKAHLFDGGTYLMLDDDGQWWARREITADERAHDEVNGKTVGWEPIEQSVLVKFWREAIGNPYERRSVGIYELCGPKVNRNPEGYTEHVLIKHDDPR